MGAVPPVLRTWCALTKTGPRASPRLGRCLSEPGALQVARTCVDCACSGLRASRWETMVIHLVAALRTLLRLAHARTSAWLCRLVEAARLPNAVDTELEQWARRTFAELKVTPLVQPSRDLVDAVRERIERHHAGGQNDAAGHEPPPPS